VAVSIGAAMAVVLAVTPGQAQKGPAPQGGDPISDGFSFCATGADDISGGALSAAGWTIDDQFEYGPFYTSLSVSRNGGDDTGFVSLQPYATYQLVYCTYDIYIGDAAFDMQAAAEAFGLDGHVETDPDGTYGTWELLEDDGIFLQASVSGGYFYFELNWYTEL
jgi:hypothetical protein